MCHKKHFFFSSVITAMLCGYLRNLRLENFPYCFLTENNSSIWAIHLVDEFWDGERIIILNGYGWFFRVAKRSIKNGVARRLWWNAFKREQKTLQSYTMAPIRASHFWKTTILNSRKKKFVSMKNSSRHFWLLEITQKLWYIIGWKLGEQKTKFFKISG